MDILPRYRSDLGNSQHDSFPYEQQALLAPEVYDVAEPRPQPTEMPLSEGRSQHGTHTTCTYSRIARSPVSSKNPGDVPTDNYSAVVYLVAVLGPLLWSTLHFRHGVAVSIGIILTVDCLAVPLCLAGFMAVSPTVQ